MSLKKNFFNFKNILYRRLEEFYILYPEYIPILKLKIIKGPIRKLTPDSYKIKEEVITDIKEREENNKIIINKIDKLKKEELKVKEIKRQEVNNELKKMVQTQKEIVDEWKKIDDKDCKSYDHNRKIQQNIKRTESWVEVVKKNNNKTITRLEQSYSNSIQNVTKELLDLTEEKECVISDFQIDESLNICDVCGSKMLEDNIDKYFEKIIDKIKIVHQAEKSFQGKYKQLQALYSQLDNIIEKKQNDLSIHDYNLIRSDLGYLLDVSKLSSFYQTFKQTQGEILSNYVHGQQVKNNEKINKDDKFIISDIPEYKFSNLQHYLGVNLDNSSTTSHDIDGNIDLKTATNGNLIKAYNELIFRMIHLILDKDKRAEDMKNDILNISIDSFQAKEKVFLIYRLSEKMLADVKKTFNEEIKKFDLPMKQRKDLIQENQQLSKKIRESNGKLLYYEELLKGVRAKTGFKSVEELMNAYINILK